MTRTQVQTQDYEAMGEALGDACAVLRNNAASAGLGAPVPTCPGWTVRDLVLHQGSVHRWAHAILTGATPPSEEEALAGADEGDLLDWFDDGMAGLLGAFANAPADLDVWFFLPDAPAPRDAWLRRQVHETSIHAVDAMAARLGRLPAADELWLPGWVAADGVDELLTGMSGHPKGMLGAEATARVLVEATDTGHRWLLETGAERTRATRSPGPVDAEVTVTGTARQLYTGFWNRGGEVVASDPAWWAAWGRRVQVTR